MSVQAVRPRTTGFLRASFVFLTISVVGSAVFFWHPWTGSEMEPGSVEGLFLTGFLIMIMIGLAAMAVGAIRYVEGGQESRPRV